jgi:hypothetical protein
MKLTTPRGLAYFYLDKHVSPLWLSLITKTHFGGLDAFTSFPCDSSPSEGGSRVELVAQPAVLSAWRGEPEGRQTMRWFVRVDHHRPLRFIIGGGRVTRSDAFTYLLDRDRAQAASEGRRHPRAHRNEVTRYIFQQHSHEIFDSFSFCCVTSYPIGLLVTKTFEASFIGP